MNETKKLFSNAAFIYIDGSMIKGWHRCASIAEFQAHFPEYKGELDNDLLHWVKPFPSEELMLSFAGLCKDFPHTEVMATLYFSPKENDWIMYVPEQQSSAASISYDAENYEPPATYNFLGTIHTHPEMGAFWSGTDKKDQCGKDGIHIVVGLKDGLISSHKCSLFFHQVEYSCDKAITIPAKDAVLPEAPEEWKAKIQPPKVRQSILSPSTSIWDPANLKKLTEKWEANLQKTKNKESLRFPGLEDYHAQDIEDSIAYDVDQLMSYYNKDEIMMLCTELLREIKEDEVADYVESNMMASDALSDSFEFSEDPDGYGYFEEIEGDVKDANR